jgi:hypothetical protein
LDVYLADLTHLDDWAMANHGIGSNKVYEVLYNELQRANAIRHNAHTVEVELNDWIHNFAYNLERMPKKSTGWRDRTIPDSAIVVGAGPSLTDEQILDLNGYEGTIICVNKSLERMYRLGVTPDWVVMVHTTDEILPHFANDLVRQHLHGSHVLMSSLGHPSVTDEILAHADPDKVFWYNPSVPDCFAPTVDRMMAQMSQEIVVDTGGNVGIWGLVVAVRRGAKNVGLLGMEHCHDITKVTGWTNQQAAGYSYQWAPEDDQFYCITPMFRAYLLGLVMYINKIAEQTTVYNLTPFGPMYAQRNIVGESFSGVPYRPLKEFVREFK